MVRFNGSDREEQVAELARQLLVTAGGPAVHARVSREDERGRIELENRRAIVDVAGRELHTFRRHVGAHVPAVYRWSKPWIDAMRTHAGDASILEAVETLSAQWELRNRDLAEVLDTPTWREGKAPT